ncbi:MAG: muconolactone Delta-isomerase family protein [Actinobacteria bacterium]|nr:muconolactone Delta-isomerase family protein [Actinomycetota bacterium]
MEFLVEIRVDLPPDLRDRESPRRAELLAAELRRGVELREEGTILRIWRVPGEIRNVGIWSAPDATRLHEALASLPLWTWMRIQVTALATHPVEAELSD